MSGVGVVRSFDSGHQIQAFLPGGTSFGLTTTKRMHYFNFVTLDKHVIGMPAFRHDASIDFNGNPPFCITLLFKQPGKAGGSLQVEYLAV